MVASKKIFDHTPEENSNSNNAHSLLSFMNLASNKVKTALEKPNTFKRNINHRRFLQKQFKAMVKSPEKTSSRRLTLAKENVDLMNFTLCEYNRQTCHPPPLNHNSLQFEALAVSVPNLAFEKPSYCAPFARSEDFDGEQCLRRQAQSDAFDRGHIAKENDCLYQSACYSSIPEMVVEEDFLTGEELTQAIELKDLFIPETDLTQYLLNGKENVGSFCNSDATVERDGWLCHDFAPQEDILVF